MKAESWQGETFDEKVAALLIDRSGIAPFFTARSAVVVSEGRAYTAVPAQYEKLAEALAKAKAVVTVDAKALTESDFPADSLL